MATHPVLVFVRGLTPPRIVTDILGRENVARRAEQYAADRRVEQVWCDGAALRAHVAGSQAAPYHCVLRLADGHLEPECSCPYRRGVCWHVGAVLLDLAGDPARLASLEQQAARGTVGSEPEAGAAEPVGEPARREAAATELLPLLLTRPKALLADLLAEAAAHDAHLEARVREVAADSAGLDVRLFRQAARAALRPGVHLDRFDAARAAADLADIAASVGRLAGGSAGERALELLLELAWAAWQRVDDADDRDGTLVATARTILDAWCRGWAEVPTRDRPRLAREIFGWMMEDGGRTMDGLAMTAREALGAIGLETLAGLLSPVLAARAAPGADDAVAPDPLAERARRALREVAEARGDLDGYLEQCRDDGIHGDDLLAAARRLALDGRLDEALLWLERGRKRTRGAARAACDDMRITLLARLDRRREAIDAAWDAFRREPGGAAFSRLVGVVAEPDRAEWRRRALDHAEAGSDAAAFVECCVAAHDAERLAHRLSASPGYVFSAGSAPLERAAVLLEAGHAASAARLWTELALRLLAEGDPRMHGDARKWLERARRAHVATGEHAAWAAELERIARNFSIVAGWFGEG